MRYLVIFAVIVGFFILNGNDSSVGHNSELYDYTSSFRDSDRGNYYSGQEYLNEEEEKSIDRDTAISDHWDEISDYVNGPETIEACSGSGCYDLDADISSGDIDTVNFPNGGYLSPEESIDDSGSASFYDNQGNNWDFQVDMDSSVVDDAVQEWAADNGYEIE